MLMLPELPGASWGHPARRPASHPGTLKCAEEVRGTRGGGREGVRGSREGASGLVSPYSKSGGGESKCLSRKISKSDGMAIYLSQT